MTKMSPMPQMGGTAVRIRWVLPVLNPKVVARHLVSEAKPRK